MERLLKCTEDRMAFLLKLHHAKSPSYIIVIKPWADVDKLLAVGEITSLLGNMEPSETQWDLIYFLADWPT